MKGRKPKLTPADGGAVTTKCPLAPTWFPAHAKAEWRRAAPELHRRGHLTTDTRATLESYCIAAGQVRETEETMTREGRVVSTPTGPKTHPAFRIQATAMREARLLAAELGLTPHRRGKSTNDDKDGGDGWDSDLLA